MISLKVLFAFSVLSTAQNTASAGAGQEARQQLHYLGPNETLGDPFRSGTVYVALEVNVGYLVSVATTRLAYAFRDDDDADCSAVAAAKGAHFYLERGYSELECMLGEMRFSLCTEFNGTTTVYIHPDFITGGTTNENAYIDSVSIYHAELREYFAGSYRIQDPTVVEFADFLMKPLIDIGELDWPFGFQVALTKDESEMLLPPEVIADPACHTNNTCAVPFLQFGNVSNVPYKILPDLCGMKVTVNSGEELNILSHPLIGCEYFPPHLPGYIDTDCRVNIRGDVPLRIKMTYVNFVADDHCDGFKIGLVVTDALDNKNVTKLCRSPIPEIVAPLGEGKINFSGESVTGRKKYGFIVNISNA